MRIGDARTFSKTFLLPNEIYQVDMMIQMICQQDIKVCRMIYWHKLVN